MAFIECPGLMIDPPVASQFTVPVADLEGEPSLFAENLTSCDLRLN